MHSQYNFQIISIIMLVFMTSHIDKTLSLIRKDIKIYILLIKEFLLLPTFFLKMKKAMQIYEKFALLSFLFLLNQFPKCFSS